MIQRTTYDQHDTSQQTDNPFASHFAPLARKLCQAADTRFVGITSPDRQAGTTTVAMQLARAIAQACRKSVLLVDANLHLPAIAQQFGMQQQLGMLDWASGNAELDDCLHVTDDEHLSVLPLGKIAHPDVAIDDLLMKQLREQIGSRFDHVIVDMPVACETNYTSLLANVLDQVLVVVEAGRSQTGEIATSLSYLRANHVNVAGVIFNKFEATPSFRLPTLLGKNN